MSVRAFARDAVTSFQENDESPTSNELVYGELRVEVLSRRILDAVGVCGVISTQMILNDRLSKKKDIFE
eukprot:scaffold101_cov80-Skeletonema_menzelii.AAC.3